jgi:ABC-2 type transport system permease protein
MGLAPGAVPTQATIGADGYGLPRGARPAGSLKPGSGDDLPLRVVSARVSIWRRLAEIWASRELLVFLVRKELKVRYKNSVLGFLWSFLNPAMVLMIYYVVFKFFLKNPMPDFAIYLFAGLLPWNLFNTSLLSSSGVLVAHAGLVKKVAFPREVLPLSQVGTAICYFFFQTCILVAFLAGFHVVPAVSYLPVLLFAVVCDIVLASGLSVFLSAINVYLRDVQHLVEILLVAWFWAPPIVYSFATVSPHLQAHLWFRIIYEANPLFWIVLAFQRTIFGKVVPPTGRLHVPGVTGVYYVLPHWQRPTDYLIGLGCVFVGAVIFFLIAMVVFSHVEGNFAEEL